MNKTTKRFGDFADDYHMLDGDKVSLNDIFNREIEVLAVKVSQSKFGKNKSGSCLTLQFIFPESPNERKVAFTGSDVLIEQSLKYQDEVPFLTVIKKIDKFYSMT